MGVGNIATSGLKAAMTNMQSISNNIANVNTLGYKKTYVNFSSLYAGGFGGNSPQVGTGTSVSSIGQDFSLGRIEASSSGLDLSISNDGFFVQRAPSTGLVSYTRAGRMNIDQNGFLQGPNGNIQGYASVNGKIVTSGSLTDLKVPTTSIPASATQNVNFSLNLDANSSLITTPFSMTDPTTYNYSTNETVYDSLGNSYPMSVYYVNLGNNNWTAYAAVNNNLVGTGSLSFSNSGALDTATGLTGLSWTPNPGAATPQALNISLTGSTQYAGDDVLNSHNQDGYQSGNPLGCSIDSNGNINVYYSNGLSQAAGQIAVAQFSATQGLVQTDNSSWLQTTNSGNPIIGTGSNAIVSNSVEYSNVDLTEELVNLIEAQHDFQASAQIQQTYDQMLQTIENL